MTDAVGRKKILGLAGLGLRGRLAVVGVQQVRDAARRGKLKLALVANDASQNSLDKVQGLLMARHVPVVDLFGSAELGSISGRDAVAVLGITDAGLARGIRAAADNPEQPGAVTDGDAVAPRRARRDSRR